MRLPGPSSVVLGEVMLTAEDTLAIHQLIALYGHIIDSREFARASDIFAEDAVYDTSAFDGHVHHGAQAISDVWAAYAHHPLAHHATNVVVTETSDGKVSVASKGLGVRRDNSVRTTNYLDEVKRTPTGWRIVRRVALPRSTGYIDPPSR
jgi:ketosteroid isomerase-like protein